MMKQMLILIFPLWKGSQIFVKVGGVIFGWELKFCEIYVGREWTELGLSVQGEGGMCEPLEVNCRKISAFTLLDDT